LSHFKASTRLLFNEATKTGTVESYKMALTSYHKEINAEQSSWTEYCRGIENVPDRTRLRRIMASQLVNKVGSVKLPNRCHTQAGIETLKELYRVHFPGSDAGETTWQRQGQPTLRTFTAHREEWELSKRVTDRSKIRQAINTLNPFKSAGTDEIVPAVLQQGVDYLTTHVCQIFRACLARGYLPIAWGKLK
jgi:hypothetical protein